MASEVDWGRVMKADVNELGPDDVSDFYKMLEEYEPPNDIAKDKVLQLFNVSQAVMISKALEAEELEKNLLESVEEEGKASAKIGRAHV